MTRKQDRKARVQELANDLRKSTAFEVLAIKEMLNLMVEMSKDEFIAADPADFHRLQGEARAFTRLHEMVSRAPVLTKE